ncbi:unnamed protein product [Lactuca saligna]|uniref:Uncharacterized protein n=1 Tax=Lactuca saligna TaxID=75948 RepID=A0AA35VP47_LACSI|nr:unnamed protein product [Lactuca saligna]
MESDSASDHDEDSKERGPTTKVKANKVKLIVTYNKKDVTVGKEAIKLSTFEGLVARTMVRITYESLLEVSDEVKEELWQYVLVNARNHQYEEEIDRARLCKKARELKIRGYESDVKMNVDKIDELHKSRSIGVVTCGTHDMLTEALDTQEQCGHVRGMGKFITPLKYFYLPKNVKYYLEIENTRIDKRINKLEDDLEKLKRDVLNVSKSASCQVWGVIEDLEKEPRDESRGNVAEKPVKKTCNTSEERCNTSEGSYTYITWDDFEAVFTMDELIGAVIVPYMVVLFNKMKYAPQERDHGICFVNPTLISPRTGKGKSKNIDNASRGLADRLSSRKSNDIIFIPTIPEDIRYWVY